MKKIPIIQIVDSQAWKRRNNARLQAKAGELLMQVVMPMNLLQKKLAKLVHAAT